MSVEVSAALIAAATSILVAFVTALSTSRLQSERLRMELKTEFMAEEAVRQRLIDDRWTMRTFERIRNLLGGFDDELRRLLVRAGAVRFTDRDGEEAWGLRDPITEKLGPG